MRKYAIVQPTICGFGTIVALCDGDRPTTLRPMIAVELKGYYRADIGKELPYEMCVGGYREALVDTRGT